MALNMKSLTQALAKTAAVIEKHVQSTVQEVTGPKALQDYELIDQIGSAGPGLAWKLYSARPRNKAEHAHNPEVCVWLLDKKAISETRQRLGITKAAEDAFLDVLRADAAQLLKLRHPGVVRVIQALDESKTAMAMVTEPIFASLANVLGDMRNLVKVPKVLKGLELSFLEIKHGLLQLAESLSFLHNNAQLVHRAISPEIIFITSSGSWKFGGFGFAVSVEQAASGASTGPAFHYSEYDTEESFLPLQPDLDYTAPELTRSGGNPGPPSDIFSLGCVAYHLLSREPLMQCKSNLRAYKNKMQYLSSSSFSKIPSELIHGLRSMLSLHELSRPTAKDFTGSPYFREDTRLRALRFLDHMLESDNIQKTDFLKALSSMWKDFDARVLRYKVLPPLCAELRNVVMLPMVLPMVLTIAESQERADFESSTFPALQPVLSSATGESLLLLVKHAALLINKVGPEQLGTSVVPMLVRAYDDPDARMQEEVLKRTLAVAKQIDYQVLKQSILPRIHSLTLRTTVAAVRVNGLLCLGELVHRLDKQAMKEVLQTIKMCTDVDRSAATLMCTLGVANAIHKQFGVEFTTEHVLPLVTPLLTAQQLSSQQFAKYMHFVKGVLSEIEERRGVGDGHTPHTTAEVTVQNGSILDQATTKTNKSTWDIDDWRSMDWAKPAAPAAAKPAAELSVPSAKASSVGAALEWPSTQQQSSVGPPVSALEWPSPEQQSTLTELSSTASYGDDFDPFADWPPRSSRSTTKPTTQLQPQQDLSSFLSSNKPAVSSSYSASARRLAPPPPGTQATNNAVLDLLQ